MERKNSIHCAVTILSLGKPLDYHIHLVFSAYSFMFRLYNDAFRAVNCMY